MASGQRFRVHPEDEEIRQRVAVRSVEAQRDEVWIEVVPWVADGDRLESVVGVVHLHDPGADDVVLHRTKLLDGSPQRRWLQGTVRFDDGARDGAGGVD